MNLNSDRATDELIPSEFWLGVEQFNQRSFYTCHDTLESLWMQASQPQKAFYQGILQIAVAFYHLENANWQGSVTLLGEGTHRLRPYQPTYSGIDVETLIHQSLTILSVLQQQGVDSINCLRTQLQRSPLPEGDRIDHDKNTTLSESDWLSFPVIIRASEPRADTVHPR
jgi:predicted metal-dependent hydrolase